eukprot:TRINITY_DN121861_c1_g1_i1.p1 TRINITY_DN121861_c1_g1~~TRINITY_DN121861_c1_g1_i1.p1  ORF type:complete len:295 (+),score=47.39 TRINITY_DN121861_c1_g1_i1:576-1460(+)
MYFFLLKSNNGREITKRLANSEALIKKAANGEKPVVEFKMASEFTRRVTLLLYKWILISHVYMYYRGVQDEVKKRLEISPDDIQEIFIRKEEDKIRRRYDCQKCQSQNRNDLIKRYYATGKPNEDYRIALQRAYFTYLTNDELFEKEINELLDLHTILMKLVTSTAVIPEFEIDPFDMREDEFEKLYEKLYNDYVKPIPTAAQLAETLPVPGVGKTLSAAEKVQSIQMPEGVEKADVGEQLIEAKEAVKEKMTIEVEKEEQEANEPSMQPQKKDDKVEEPKPEKQDEVIDKIPQ